MNALERQVTSGLKQQGMSRGELAANIGYKNISKGLRRIDSFLRLPDPGNPLSDKLAQVLSIPKDEFSHAIENTRRSIEQKERLDFKPFLQVRLMKAPSPIFVAAMVPGLTRIEIPESLSELPHDEEMETVRELYQKHRRKYSPGWPAGNGFCYYRDYDKTWSFDVSGKLIEEHQCKPYSIGWRV